MICSSVTTGSVTLPYQRASKGRDRRAETSARASAQDDKDAPTVISASSRRGLLVGAALSIAPAWTRAARAEELELPPKDYSTYNSGAGGAEQSELVKRLLAKSAENKDRNDAERKAGIDKTYDSYLAIAKGTGYVPDDQKTRDRLGITRPPECDLPFFKDSPTCGKF